MTNPEHLYASLQSLDPGSPGYVTCNTCEYRCNIPKIKGREGVCGAYAVGDDVELYLETAGFMPIRLKDTLERLAIRHFPTDQPNPQAKVLSLGSIACDFRCAHCGNSEFAFLKGSEVTQKNFEAKYLAPEAAVVLAKKLGAIGIVYGYAEPTTQLEWFLKTGAIAHANGLYNIWETNGYATRAALYLAIPLLDVYRLGIRGPQEAYDAVSRGEKLDKILTNAIYVKSRGVHTELTLMVIEGLSDGKEWLEEISLWVKNNLGKDTPVHFEPRFSGPEFKVVPTSTKKLSEAKSIAENVGLSHVYIYDVRKD